MHVARLLGALVPVPHDKIVEAPLPDTALLKNRVPQTSVRTVQSLSEFLQQFAGVALLEHLQNDRMILFVRFGQEEVHMLRHDHISNDNNSVADSGFFEDAQEEVTTLRRTWQRTAMVTTEGDEVKTSGTVGAAKTGGHAESLC